VFVRANVLIVCLEDGRTELRRRVRAAMKHHRIARDEVKGRLFLTTPTGMKMAQRGAKGSVVVRGDLDRAIRTFIDEKKIDLVIIDPIKKAHSVEENDNNDMDAVVTILAQLAIEKAIAVDICPTRRKLPAKRATPTERAGPEQ
jgi:RecA-family ATPase